MWQLFDQAAGSVAWQSLMKPFDVPSAAVLWRWIRPREMPQEVPRGGKEKQKLWTDHQNKATAKKVIILGRTFNVLYGLSNYYQ